jgi:hypothetical protein
MRCVGICIFVLRGSCRNAHHNAAQKKKHAVESVKSFVESVRRDQSLGATERDAALEVYKVLIKYLERQAEAEYRVKLESLRQTKRQAKEQAAALAAAVPRKRSTRKMSSGSPVS